MAAEFEKNLPGEIYYHPVDTPPPPMAGMLPVPAEEITWDGSSWTVTSDRFVTGGAMHLANELNWMNYGGGHHRDEIALVLTDVMTMPAMGGVALSRALRERNPAIKVVTITGYPLEAETKDRLALGIVDWLSKPLNLKQLAQTVSRSLKSERVS